MEQLFKLPLNQEEGAYLRQYLLGSTSGTSLDASTRTDLLLVYFLQSAQWTNAVGLAKQEKQYKIGEYPGNHIYCFRFKFTGFR